MKQKFKLLNWYHMYIDFSACTLSEENLIELQHYLSDKQKEFKLANLHQAFYVDHLHLLFTLSPDEPAGQIAKNLEKAIAWFLTALTGENYDLSRDYVMITISPGDVNQVIDYLSDHVDLHLQKKINSLLEQTKKQWSAWEKREILKENR